MLKVIAISFLFCFILERIIPGWKLPIVKTWYSRVVIINIIQLLIVLMAEVSWEKWLNGISIFNLSEKVNPYIGGFFAYFIATFIFYWWHKVRHTNNFLWLHFHQIHHSPQRLEVSTSFYKHPLEMITNSIVGAILVFSILGLSLESAAIYTLCTALGEFFYHTNIKTPQWVGYFFQRPEMHRIHHEYNKHKNNYGDIVWWDIIFGTYENPKTFKSTCGFDEEKENRLLEMIKFKDIHQK